MDELDTVVAVEVKCKKCGRLIDRREAGTPYAEILNMFAELSELHAECIERATDRQSGERER
jgi:hypothetical protein